MKFLIINILILFSCTVKDQKDVVSFNLPDKTQIHIPVWVRKTLDEDSISLSKKELETLSLLDITGDAQIDAIFIRNNELLFIDKKNGVSELSELKDYDGDTLNNYNWVDFWYVDDALKADSFPFVESMGQVLILGKESSGSIAVYYNEGFHWVSFD